MKSSVEFDLSDRAQATALATVLEVLHPGVFSALTDTVTMELGEIKISGRAGDLLTMGADPSVLAAFRADGAGLDAAQVFATAPAAELPGDEPGDLDAGGGVTAPAGSPPPPPAPGLATAPDGVQLDKAGLPWDARIHATVAGGGGKLNAGTGLWRAKAGVSKDLVATVGTELRAALSARPQPSAGAAPAPTPETVSTPSGAPVAPPPPAAPPVSPPSGEAAPTPPAGAGPTVPPPGAPLPDAPTTTPQQQFAVIMRDVTALQSAGRLTADDVNATLTACGLEALRDLLVRPDLIPTFKATIDAFTRPEA